LIHKICDISQKLVGRVDLVVAKITDINRKNIRPLFDAEAVTINGRKADGPWAKVKVGDKVEVNFDPQKKLERPEKAWKDAAFTIVFEDDHLIVVNKAAAILTVPASKGQSNTLVHRICSYFTQGKAHRKLAHIVHRLDQGVSGLLVFGKSEQVADALRSQFEARKPDRLYMAIVNGKVETPEGTFRSLLATDQRLNRFSTKDETKGELAITHYKVEKTLTQFAGGEATLVTVQLETGRRNQIRVHFAEAGHPVLGDKRYRADEARHPRWKVNRLALHAATLGFSHPTTGQILRFSAPMPGPMQRFLEGGVCGAPALVGKSPKGSGKKKIARRGGKR
jgi:23S rRNA pseudouridine1911/1915/1917 synthase